ncbi:MAG: hypothetical protein NTY38_15620 [Acidobacteria bacterium]|nr:hypothetical protein [Acidobacteriota bacterium]
MASQGAVPAPEIRVADFLAAQDPTLDELILGRLLFEQAEPVIRRVVQGRLFNAPVHDREDIAGEVLVDLIERLRAMKLQRPAPVIDQFRGYVASSTHHACSEYLRRRYPERHRLKNRVRYLIGKSPGYESWQDDAGVSLCGPPRWRGQPARPVSPELREQRPARASPKEVLDWLFATLGAPARLDDLVELFAEIWAMRDQSGDHSEEEVVSNLPDPAQLLEERRALEGLWGEVVQLPLAQRIALLLNLRDLHGESALGHLPETGIASLRSIAALLEMKAEELAAMWNRLPLEDREIAERLGITRQQVINLRAAARQRLARRTRR